MMSEVRYKERITSIDGLRGIACIGIMLFHFEDILIKNGIWIIDYAWIFVEIFFTISGFMMAYNYKERIPNIEFGSFFFKRYLSVMPLYWLTDICMWIAMILGSAFSERMMRIDSYTFLQVILEFLGIFGGWKGESVNPLNGPLWTISSLLLCYVIFYIICRISNNSKNRYSIIVYILFLSSLSIKLYLDECDSLLLLYDKDTYMYLASFIMGLILYEIYTRVSCLGGKVLAIMYWIILLSASVIIISEGMTDLSIMGKDTSMVAIFIFCPLTILSSLYIKSIRKILSTKVFCFLGAISMSVYMWHQVVRTYVGSRPLYLDQTTWLGFFTLIFSTLLVATISKYVVEPRLKIMVDKVISLFVAE